MPTLVHTASSAGPRTGAFPFTPHPPASARADARLAFARGTGSPARQGAVPTRGRPRGRPRVGTAPWRAGDPVPLANASRASARADAGGCGVNGNAPVRGPAELAVCTSVGIRRYAEELSGALAALGWDCPVADGPRDPAARRRSRHFHFGNSCRSLLPTLATGPSSVVTLHDVVPRQRLLRATLGWLQQPVLARHL